jgi:hypothetical protein
MSSLLNDNQLEVLANVQKTLEENDILFIAIGGLASIAWGVNRPLADIDIQVQDEDLLAVKRLLSDYMVTDIRHYVTEKWDIQQMVLSINGVGVDVCGAEVFYVIKDGKRYRVKNSIDNAVVKEVQHLQIPVLPKEQLIAYKEIIGRPVDLRDLTQLLS